MKTIFKYRLELADSQVLRLPKGAKLLTVQIQHGAPHVWAEVDDTQELEDMGVWIFGTGHPLSAEGLTYLGTYQLYGGQLVFHVYYQLRETFLKRIKG